MGTWGQQDGWPRGLRPFSDRPKPHQPRRPARPPFPASSWLQGQPTVSPAARVPSGPEPPARPCLGHAAPCGVMMAGGAGPHQAPTGPRCRRAQCSRLPSPSQHPSPGSVAAVSKRQREGWACRLPPAMLQQRPAALAGSAAIAGGCRSRPAEGLRWQRSAGPLGGKRGEKNTQLDTAGCFLTRPRWSQGSGDGDHSAMAPPLLPTSKISPRSHLVLIPPLTQLPRIAATAPPSVNRWL